MIKTYMNTVTTNTIPVSSHAFEEAGIPIIFHESNNVQQSSASVSLAETSALERLRTVDSWLDAELLESVCGDIADETALGVLVTRYWDSLFARCQMLTLNREKALDLAQATWCRLLRNRQKLKADGNFPAYLATIATNLFRDSYRAARRAGPMADHRLESLNATCSNADGDEMTFVDIVPDLKSLQEEEQTLLAIDIDLALEQLSPQLREVLVARFMDGESCAEIGRRYGRTEQSVSGWVRAALRQMKTYLEESDHTRDYKAQESCWQPSFARKGCIGSR